MSAQPTASGRNNPRLAAQQAVAAAGEARPTSKPLEETDVPAPPAPPMPRERRSMAERRAAAEASRQGRTARGRKPRRRWPKVLALCLLAVLMVAVAAVGATFTYVRWFAHDDAADMEGTWYLAGTATPITIADGRIQLTEDVSYPYTLNPTDKTIEFSFANLNGAGSYRFSLDRNQLALVDGALSESDTLASDFGWMAKAAVALLQGQMLSPGEEGQPGLTLLSRTPAPTASGLSDDVARNAKKEAAKDSADADSDKGEAAKKDGKKKSSKKSSAKDEKGSEKDAEADSEKGKEKKADTRSEDAGDGSAS